VKIYISPIVGETPEISTAEVVPIQSVINQNPGGVGVGVGVLVVVGVTVEVIAGVAEFVGVIAGVPV
jgi:hypothetical protein